MSRLEDARVAAMPAGNTAAFRLTKLENPLMLDTVIVETPLPPGVMERLEGLADRAKSGLDGTVTTNLAVTLWDSVPPLPNTPTT